MMIKRNRKGFTLVEIMIVVAIIGLLAAIAIPNFVRARARAQANACIANLKQVEGAIQVWAIDTGAAADANAPTVAELVTQNYLRAPEPTCPLGGSYTTGKVDGRPTCPNAATTDPAHVLPGAAAAA